MLLGYILSSCLYLFSRDKKMVHPNVLENCGFDHTKYQGFAFGVGIERVTMLKYASPDIRNFYTNNYRFLHNCDSKEI